MAAASSAGGECARYCAKRLAPLVASALEERVGATSAWSSLAADDSQNADPQDPATAWAEALTAGFHHCDRLACGEVAGSCSALLCAVAHSGVYIASVGLARAVVGTEEDGGATVMCDEASGVHTAESEAEVARLRAIGPELVLPVPGEPTRLLGAALEKRSEPHLIGLPDVVRHPHADGRRFVILASAGVWGRGPRLPVQWAIEAYRVGGSPADVLIERCEGDSVALVLVLPPGLGGPTSPLIPDGRRASPRLNEL